MKRQKVTLSRAIPITAVLTLLGTAGLVLYAFMLAFLGYLLPGFNDSGDPTPTINGITIIFAIFAINIGAQAFYILRHLSKYTSSLHVLLAIVSILSIPIFSIVWNVAYFLFGTMRFLPLDDIGGIMIALVIISALGSIYLWYLLLFDKNSSYTNKIRKISTVKQYKNPSLRAIHLS